MTRNKALEHLKNSTVKIDNTFGLSTGFFIADKLIATCYHNIKNHNKNELAIYWQGEEYLVQSIEINEDDDLALLEIKIDKRHPILQMDKNMEVGDICQSFGYSTESGDIITFEYEGRNEKLLKFKEGLFQVGFSGAPILNFQTLKVCGIVQKTRDLYSPLGGYAIPITKLFNFERLNKIDNNSIFSKEMFKSWVWTSNYTSIDKIQFSFLAFIETASVISIYFGIYFYYGRYEHIILGTVIAPFFLFTKDFTKSSQNLLITGAIIGLLLPFSEKMYIAIQALFGLTSLSYIFIVVLGTLTPIIIIFTIRILLLVISNIGNISSILNISKFNRLPINWFKITLSFDSLVYTREIFKRNNFQLGFIENIKVMHVISYLLAMISIYNIKAIAWIYLPLVWFIQPQDKSNLNTRMKIESKNFIAYIMYIYSLIVVFSFTLMPLLYPETAFAIPPTLKTIFFAYEFNLWHLTRLVSALITIVFMLSFTKILIYRETDPSYGDTVGAKLLSLRSVRSVLTLVTLGFTAYHILGLLAPTFFSDLWGNMKFS